MSDIIPHSVVQTLRPDGTIELASRVALGPVVRNTGVWLHHWAETTPGAVFLAERDGPGWRQVTYAVALQQVQQIARALLARGMDHSTPVAMLSGNGIDHGLLALAAQYVGIPVVPLAEQYALIPGAHDRLLEALAMVRPGLVHVSDAARFGAAITLPTLAGIEVVASTTDGTPRPVTAFADLLRGDGCVNLAAAHARVGPETLAKIIMTSGSSSAPKGVLTTQGMLCVNQAQIAAVLPVLRAYPPRIVDWLPWNHVFGGSHNFNMMLAHGGSLYIDDGKPTRAGFARTVENLSMVRGTIAFNVPVGFSMLVAEMRRNPALARQFFAELDLMFYAGASLPPEVWDGLEQLATDVRGAVPMMISSWGMTETAPASLMVHENMGRAGVIGVPLPGVRAKLLPPDEGRHELRVTGPNVMPGYFNDPAKTAEAFDDEGFLITGDVVRFRDPGDFGAGLVFDGRVSEDFKLLTGTWVRAAGLRMAVMGQLQGLVQDVVIAGQDMRDIGLLVFPNLDVLDATAQRDGDLLVAPGLAAQIAERLGDGAGPGGSSTRIARAVLLADPPSLEGAEVTPKGNLAPRRVLMRRAVSVARLYDDADPAVIGIKGAQP